MTERPTEGGSYIRQPNGRLERVEEPTQPHPDGDAPRNEDGEVIGTQGVPIAPPGPEALPTPDPEQEA